MEQSREIAGLDVQGVLLDMRRQRLGLIQTPDQLRFSYIAILQGAANILGLEKVAGPAPESDEEEEEEEEEEEDSESECTCVYVHVGTRDAATGPVGLAGFHLTTFRSPKWARRIGQPDSLSVILGNGEQDLLREGNADTGQIDYQEN